MSFDIDMGRLGDPAFRAQALNQVQTLTQAVSDNVLCDSECKREKKIQTLREKYEKAKRVKKNIPTIYRDAERDYLVFSKGEPYYNEVLEERYKATAQQILKEYLKKHRIQMESLDNELDLYSSGVLYEQNMRDLWKRYEREEKMLRLKKAKLNNEISVSNRESSYEDASRDRQEMIKKIVLSIYYFIVFIFLVYIIAKKRFNEPILWLAFVVLLFFPYVKAFLLEKGASLKDTITAYFNNVYLQENDVSTCNRAIATK